MEPWNVTTYRLRTWHQLTQRGAADVAGVSLATWHRWERGLTEPSDYTARRVLEEFAAREAQRWAVANRA